MLDLNSIKEELSRAVATQNWDLVEEVIEELNDDNVNANDIQDAETYLQSFILPNKINIRFNKNGGVLKVSVNAKGCRPFTKHLQRYNHLLKVEKPTKMVNPIIEKQIGHTGDYINVSEGMNKIKTNLK